MMVFYLYHQFNWANIYIYIYYDINLDVSIVFVG